MILRFKKGFSLIELLVVIAIIGILAAVGITAYSGYTTDAKEKAALAQHSQVVKFINTEFVKCAGGSGNYVWTVSEDGDVGGGVSVIDYLADFGYTPDTPGYDEIRTMFLEDDAALDEPLLAENQQAAPPVTDSCSDVSDETHIASHVKILH